MIINRIEQWEKQVIIIMFNLPNVSTSDAVAGLVEGRLPDNDDNLLVKNSPISLHSSSS